MHFYYSILYSKVLLHVSQACVNSKRCREQMSVYCILNLFCAFLMKLLLWMKYIVLYGINKFSTSTFCFIYSRSYLPDDNMQGMNKTHYNSVGKNMTWVRAPQPHPSSCRLDCIQLLFNFYSVYLTDSSLRPNMMIITLYAIVEDQGKHLSSSGRLLAADDEPVIVYI